MGSLYLNMSAFLKRSICLSLFCLTVLFGNKQLVAQPYGNEWISFASNNPYSLQQYFKISVWKNGIYRITQNDLLAANVPLPAIDPRRIQIFHKGKEQYIFVSGESDGVFDSGDYIEFYGKANDGWFDTPLYEVDTMHVNRRFSLFNDTAAFFLTWNPFAPIFGKRMIQETDTTFIGYTPAPYVYKEVAELFTSKYHRGYQDQNGLASTYYTGAEGYSGVDFVVPSNGGNPTSQNAMLNTPNVYTNAGPSATIQTAVLGANFDGTYHNYEIHLNGSSIKSDNFLAYDYRRHNIAISAGMLNNNNNSISVVPLLGGPANRLSVPYISLIYPHTNSFTGESGAIHISTESGLGNKTMLQFSNYNSNNSTVRYYAFSGDTVRRVSIATSNGLQMLVPTWGFKTEGLLTADAYTLNNTDFKIAAVTIDAGNPGKFINYGFTANQGDYLIISHKQLWTEAQQYKTYRQTVAGGSHTVLLTDVQHLYDQFAYGINKHPSSIRNFCKYLYDKQSDKPANLFIIGKSITSSNARSGSSFNLNLIPTMGEPPSDLTFTTKFDQNGDRFAIPTGRLAARVPSDVSLYLAKMQEYEMQPDSAWKKNVVHFCGGNTAQQVDQICGYLDEFAGIISDTCFGASVTTYRKASADPISNVSNLELKQLLKNGVSLMTFFAHAAGSTFDISIDAPSTWNNQGKYPLVLANSCYIGDIHTPQLLASEQFVLSPASGSIGFIAMPNQGYIGALYFYSSQFYKNVTSFDYGKNIGTVMQHVVDTLYDWYPTDFYLRSANLGMTLHGDPALKLNYFDKPDLAVSSNDVSFTPVNVTTANDTFSINIAIHNYAKAVGSSFTLEIKRVFPNGQDTTILVPVNPIYSIDTVRVTFNTDLQRGPGLNTFYINADSYDQIDELNELNNRTVASLLIQSGDINPVYPYQYSIVPQSNITLKASTANPFASLNTYVFQLDTNDTFLNPIAQGTISQSGGVVKWNIPFSVDSQKVYFWRVADNRVFTDTINYKWHESSFIHIPGKSGWSQAHFHQYKNNSYTNIIYNKPQREFEFVSTKSILTVKTSVNSFQVNELPEYFIDNAQIDYGVCSGNPSIHVIVIDSVNLQPWEIRYIDSTSVPYDTINPTHYWNNSNDLRCLNRNRPDKFFIYNTNDPNQMAGLENMLNDIPDGNYVALYSVFKPQYSQLPSSLKSAMSAAGAININSISDSIAYIFFYKKGDPSTAHEEFGSPSQPYISLIDSMGGNWYKGFIQSELIGPAQKWNSLHWNYSSTEPAPSKDKFILQLMGVRKNGIADTLIPNLATPLFDLYNIDQLIDPSIYPYVRFSGYIEDDSLRSPAQLQKWQVMFDEVPELAVNPSLYFKINNDTLDEGDQVSFDVAIENIGLMPADSVLVDQYVYDQSFNRLSVNSPRYKPLQPGDTLVTNAEFNTRYRTGLNSFWIEANPNNDQAEQFHFNNFANVNFFVNKDITNPLLDVTFDGVRILNGDLVSAKPHILMQLHDENKFIALNDTNKWRVFISHPSGTKTKLSFDQISCGSETKEVMKWCPAQLPKNSFKIEYQPDLLEDGLYELEVEASDESDNLSGKSNYKVQFEVLNKSTITDVINYPNPFSTATRFVFTLTGSELPDYMKIQIITVTGRIVREITQSELGPIHIGRNISEYAWDGKDQFGDQLANGLYLYRVVTSINGSDIEHKESEATKYFKNGFGKMYLMR